MPIEQTSPRDHETSGHRPVNIDLSDLQEVSPMAASFLSRVEDARNSLRLDAIVVEAESQVRNGTLDSSDLPEIRAAVAKRRETVRRGQEAWNKECLANVQGLFRDVGEIALRHGGAVILGEGERGGIFAAEDPMPNIQATVDAERGLSEQEREVLVRDIRSAMDKPRPDDRLNRGLLAQDIWEAVCRAYGATIPFRLRDWDAMISSN